MTETRMTVKHPAPGDLEPIERASRDELQALQLKRLQWTLQHAYDHVAHYRKAFDEKGISIPYPHTTIVKKDAA